MKNIFDWLKCINTTKPPAESFTDKDWEVWNSYMIHRFMSMNPDYIEVVNFVQDFPPTEKKSIYKIYREFIPKNNRWNKYIKSTSKKYNPDLVDILANYLFCSKKEVKEYLDILEESVVISILNNIGISQKDVKQLLK
tara:strand:- start:137 stop:550 length:414 start_codon:yes stop_codon:yes gene_type:complete